MAGKDTSSDIAPFVESALNMGALEARPIDAGTIRCEAWVRFKCQFGCGGYNKRLTCPPFTPTPEETARIVACYKRGLLIRGESSRVIEDVVPRLEREIFLAGYHKAIGFSSGPCRICDSCDTSARCRHPYQARPAMEACGINVFDTVRANGLDIDVVRTRRDEGRYFGLVLVD
jgi:predicted metal-binding protein